MPHIIVNKVGSGEVDHSPQFQSLYHFAEQGQSTPPLNSSFRLITWNIDFQAQGGHLRMAAALRYLEQLTSEAPKTLPLVIFLQEMTRVTLSLIQKAPWIQKRFNLTDIDPSNWRGAEYGTTTLVDRRLPVRSVYRVHYKTNMRRDGLFVDLAATSTSEDGGERMVRLCNSHFESLKAFPPLRPAQVGIVAEQLHMPEVYGGLVAGDFNAIQDFDRTLHTDNGLEDAYLALGGQEDAEEGYTWGQQAHPHVRQRYGCSRMDKIFYCGGVKVESLQRVGVGVKVEESKREMMRNLGEMEFVTDHYGLMVDVIVE
ncbi:MAG: hypothetical protein LQ348_004066 [Seirophora lacunosa]|nr:MAG: hypothetical protein LQ344_006235 [Seirophora lacunosa]KAI4187487.1 MAG: hypothetical protein LQ348_004066 [Seirophora lacunosa]